MNKHELILELNVILEKCQEEAFLEVSKEAILNLEPINDIELLKYNKLFKEEDIINLVKHSHRYSPYYLYFLLFLHEDET